MAGRQPSAVAAVDVYYPVSGGARAAAVLAPDAFFEPVLAEHVTTVRTVLPYRPGEFFLRELPPLRALLASMDRIRLVVVDGYVDLDPDGRPGLGAYVHAEFGMPVVGVAKSRFLTASHAVPVLRGASARPLLVTAGGQDHTVPPAISMATRRLYHKSPAVTDLRDFADRGHSLTIDHGWREVADVVLEWLKQRGV